ncbi:hypothetical protein [Mariniblastus fucicola]|uniref:Uncharacterized protein n=1 Tax=Mariniblastus fucicola TaxID=980251 RepID=A0A5B9P6A2_9BACT|nr:hypothetical protein [Mariniblastus fucicola]QEG20705.1 hypothetical protein MFFC18_05560 [Mariniblastus fucicola]
MKDSSKPLATPVYIQNEEQASYVAGGLFGIIAAGSFYPFCLCVVATVFSVLFFGSFSPAPSEALMLMGMVSIVGAAFGVIISAFTGMFSIALIIVMNWSLGYPLDAKSAAVSAGSLAGYIPTVWVLFSLDLGVDVEQLIAIGILGPVLAMSLGAFGAARTSGKFANGDYLVTTERPRFQLSILSMMIATAWIAVAFAISNAVGGLRFAVATAGWFFLQAAMLCFIRGYRKLKGPR